MCRGGAIPSDECSRFQVLENALVSIEKLGRGRRHLRGLMVLQLDESELERPLCAGVPLY